MHNGTFFISENQNPSEAVVFCAARAFFVTAIQTFSQHFHLMVWRLAGSGGCLAAPAALTQQPTTAISRRGWKCNPQLLHATNFPGSDFLFSQDPTSKPFASDTQRGQYWSNCVASNVLRILSKPNSENWL